MRMALDNVQRDNCFIWLQDPEQAQQLMNEQMRMAWPDLLTAIARGLNPPHYEMFRTWPIDYCWSIYQSEWATDILFRDTRSLAGLYPKLAQHGLTTFSAPDVMRFLGRNIAPNGNLPSRLRAEVTSDVKKRPEGVRIKHRLGENSIKMMTSKGVCCGSRRPLAMSATSRRSTRPKASRRRKGAGCRCARVSPICTGARRPRRPPMPVA